MKKAWKFLSQDYPRRVMQNMENVFPGPDHEQKEMLVTKEATDSTSRITWNHLILLCEKRSNG